MYVFKSGGCTKFVKGVADLVADRWLYFGLLANGAAPPPGARGFSLVLEPGDRPGRVKVIDSIVQVGGLNVAPRGRAFVADGLKRGRLDIVTDGPAPRLRFAGSWACVFTRRRTRSSWIEIKNPRYWAP